MSESLHAFVRAEHLDEATHDLEKITPQFPCGHPISAACVTSLATASLSAAVDVSSASTIDRSVSVRFAPVSRPERGTR